jgi:lipoic acid synthetase
MKSQFPDHLHRPLFSGAGLSQTNRILAQHGLNTVCVEAKCPNRGECFSNRAATFLALGKACTRNCAFCSIAYDPHPPVPSPDEPDRIARCVRDLGLVHATITMVTRDDLPDQGAGHMAAIIRAVRRLNPKTTVEVLTSDFSANVIFLDCVLVEEPQIFNHNIETVRSLTPRIRHQAEYERSLRVLRHAKESNKTIYVKSGLMTGLGETSQEVCETIEDLYRAGCDIITIGQYLQPSRRKIPVKEFTTPEQFLFYEEFGKRLGVRQMLCGPFVRSDYQLTSPRVINSLETRQSFNAAVPKGDLE